MQISDFQSFCVCEKDDTITYANKAKLALSLDKSDFILDGYVVDACKYPVKPNQKDKERVPVREVEPEENEEEENEEEEGTPASGQA